MKWLIMAVIYMTPNTTIDPVIKINAEWKFANKPACLSHLYKSSEHFKKEILEMFPKTHTFHLACVHQETIEKLHKKFKKNEI